MWQARARTISTLTFLFVVPTILGILVFWTIWRFVRWLDLSQSTRRLLFVLIGTLTLAPMLIPAATIMTAWVPHGMLIVMGPTELPAYYVQVARYVVPSFAVTGLVFWVLARQWVGADRTRGQSIWLTLAAPLVVGLLIILTYRYAIPSNDIPAYLTHQSIEHAYGERLDEVRALVDIDDAQPRIPVTQRLSSLFEADPVVLEVGLQVPTTNDPYNQRFTFCAVQARFTGLAMALVARRTSSACAARHGNIVKEIRLSASVPRSSSAAFETVGNAMC